jgi:hypothetical protein
MKQKAPHTQVEIPELEDDAPRYAFPPCLEGSDEGDSSDNFSLSLDTAILSMGRG